MSEELKEHFSAWRRLLVAALAPELLSLIALIFMPEGPLNLMHNGRDAESLGVYKVTLNYNVYYNIFILEKSLTTVENLAAHSQNKSWE